MKGTKTQKGITLIALIITIVVLLILAVVAIGAVREDGVIVKAQDAANSYKEAQIEEEVKLYSMEYYMNNKRSMKEDTINEMTRVGKETGVSPEKLTVHYNPADGSEYVLYRIDKTTEEERTILEQNGVKPLRGDFDLDGILTKEDVKKINEFSYYGEINGEDPLDDNDEIKEKFIMIFEVADINGDEWIDGSDVSIVAAIVDGTTERTIYTGGYRE